ncbi:MAG TPA: hypothetical protein P5040_07680 [Smithella sp.]|nr:hypothetical protein [Smithella sp.]HRS98053.1 hypothetical protein [Smithella sp.]
MRGEFRHKTALMLLVGVAIMTLFLFVSFTAEAAQGRGKSENTGTAEYQGTISGQWSGSVSMSSETISVSGAFSVTISEDGHVLGTYTGVQSGTITGTVNSRGEINAKGSAGISEWSGKLSVENGRLSGSGTWEGFGGGGSWKTD